MGRAFRIFGQTIYMKDMVPECRLSAEHLMKDSPKSDPVFDAIHIMEEDGRKRRASFHLPAIFFFMHLI